MICGEHRSIDVDVRPHYGARPVYEKRIYTCTLPAGHDGAHVGGALMWPKGPTASERSPRPDTGVSLLRRVHRMTRQHPTKETA